MSKGPVPVRAVSSPAVVDAARNLGAAQRAVNDADGEHAEARAELHSLTGPQGGSEAALGSARSRLRQATQALERARSDLDLRERLYRMASESAASEPRFAKADLGAHGLAEMGDGATFDAATHALRFVSAEALAQLEAEIGAAPMLEGARALAAHLGEQAAIDEAGALDALRAHAAIASAKSDPETMQRIMERRDPSARAEWSRLHELAYPKLPGEGE